MKKTISVLLRKLVKSVTFKLFLYAVLSLLLVLALFGFGLLLRIVLGILLIHRLVLLALEGFACPTCWMKFIIIAVLFVGFFVATMDKVIILLLVLMWFEYFLNRKH